MAKNSIVSANRDEALRLIRKLMGNVPFLTPQDLKIIEFLGKKGYYEDKEVVLIEKK